MKSMFVKAAATMALAAALVGCGQKVEVPPGHVGKIMTKDGYQETLIPTSKFRLPQCFTYCDRLVVLDTTDNRYVEPLEIFIPSDKLNIKLQVQATLRVDSTKTNPLFAQLPQTVVDSQLSNIPAEVIYRTYGKQILEAEVRGYLTKLTIGEIASNTDKINKDIQVLLQDVMSKRTPFTVVYAGLTNIQFPPIITEAQENTAKRREQIQNEEAQLEVSRVKLERELQEAKLQRQIDKEKAETEAMAQRTLSQSVDPQVLRLRELEIERVKAEKWNGQLPQTIMGTSVPMIMDIRK